jgi:hypothetical protein
VHDGKVEEVLQLLSGGVKINQRAGDMGYTPLHVAVYRGLANVVEMLLNHGARVSTWDTNGNSPLHLACSKKRLAGRMVIIKLLLHHGADVNDDDDAGLRPINCAIRSTSITVIKLLLKRGANISFQDDQGYNAMHDAVNCHEQSVARRNVHGLEYPLRPVNNRGVTKAVQVIRTLITHTSDVHVLIAALGISDAVGGTPEDFVDGDEVEVVELLRSASRQAQEKRRAILEAFTAGQHERLGIASNIHALAPEMVQMIMDRV